MNNQLKEWRGVISLVLEGLITLVVLCGGGFLLYTGKATEIAVSAITLVLGFWFNRRQNEKQIEHVESIMQNQNEKKSGEGE